MESKNRRIIIKTALLTRIVVILTQYIFNHLIPDHDAGVFISPTANYTTSFLDKLILHLLGGFVRWDSQYFMHIAYYGYTYENTLAFFPFYPILARLISYTLLIVFPFMNLYSMLLLVFVGLNIIFFVLSVLCLYDLTKSLFNESFAYKTAIIFCVNPASIFFVAPYTECLFSYFSFKSMLNSIILYKKYNKKLNVEANDVILLLPIALSAVTRSNGTLNIGFPVYATICLYLKHFPKICLFKYHIKFRLLIVALSILCLFPFILYQIYCYYTFCKDFDMNFEKEIISYAKINDFVLSGSFSKHNQTWCRKTIPLAYSYVQNHYWNVGFLKYYTFKQIPNFLLAFPILYIVIKHSVNYINLIFSGNLAWIFSFNKLFINQNKNSIYSPVLVVFIIHALFLSIFSLFFIHIQVTTRMLASATPTFYWFCSYHIKKLNKPSDILKMRNCCKGEKLLKLYFVMYSFVGTILFCNFLPWT